jgi:CHAT domain-containing protein
MRRIRVKSVGFWLLGMATAMLIIWGFGNGFSVVASTPNSLAQQAADLTQQGHQQMAVGQPESALEIWQKAEEMYETLPNSDGVAGSRINQSLALQAMGQSRQACKTLLMALNLDAVNHVDEDTAVNHADADEDTTDLCDAETKIDIDFSSSSLNPILKMIGLRNLGHVLRAIGKPNLAKKALEQSLVMARSLNSLADINAALLGLGNTEEALYEKQRDLFDRTGSSMNRKKAIGFAKQALTLYQEVGESERDRANLNRLSLLLELVDWLQDESNQGREETIRYKDSFQAKISPLATTLISDSTLFEAFTPIDRIYARLTLARSLSQIQSSSQFLETAFNLANEADQQAQQLDENFRIKSETLGTLGYIYEQTKNCSKSREYTHSALNLAASIHAADLVSQWAWQLGRIDTMEGKIDSAIAMYQLAIRSLASVRQDILAINPGIQFSFRNNVKPVYEELLNLLLRSPQPSQANLEQAIEVSDGFQTAELENFLRCNLVQSDDSETSKYKSEKASEESKFEPSFEPSTAIIRIVVLEKEKSKRAIEIVQPNANTLSNLFYHEVSSQDWDQVEMKIKALRKQITSDDLRNANLQPLLAQSQLIYQKLITPLQPYLPENGTLVFILDSTLQSIPIAMLQDEKGQYLIQRYKIALSLPQTIPSFVNVSPQSSGVLAVGLAINSSKPELNSWKPLENVDDELRAIKASTDSSSILRDRNFTIEKFKQRVQQLGFPIIHIATHGQFSSKSDETFLVAYDDKITINQLDEILRHRTEGTRQGIDLLVLSACQTAKDDKRGGLGLAGVAVRAGANSTIASLWNISDRSTAEFMTEFYLALAQGNLSKSDALRQVQLKFINESSYNSNQKNYKHPYYWAAFVLVENSD